MSLWEEHAIERAIKAGRQIYLLSDPALVNTYRSYGRPATATMGDNFGVSDFMILKNVDVKVIVTPGTPANWLTRVKAGLGMLTAKITVEDHSGGAHKPTDADNVLTTIELRRLRARKEAQRLLAEEESAGALGKIPPLKSLRESLENPPIAQPIRIQGLAIVGGRNTIVGPRKGGKTTLLVNLIKSLLDGTPFLNHFSVEKPVQTIAVLSYEMAEWQFTQWLDEHGLGEHGDRIQAWHLRGLPNPLASEKGRAKIKDVLDLTGSEILLVDTFVKAFYGGNPNDPGDVARFWSDLSQIAGPDRDTFTTVHTGWEGTRSRGSSELEADPDTIVTVENDKETKIRYLSILGRDVEELEGAPLDYDPETRTLSLDPLKPLRSQAKAQKRAEEKVKADDAKAVQKRRQRNELIIELLAMMRAKPGITTNEMRDKAPEGSRGNKVNEALHHAEPWNLCRVEDGPKRRRLHYLTEAGEAALEHGLPTDLSESE